MVSGEEKFSVSLLSKDGNSELEIILKNAEISFKTFSIQNLEELPNDDCLVIIDLMNYSFLKSNINCKNHHDKMVLFYVEDNFPVEKVQSFINVTNFLFVRRGLSDRQKISTISKAHLLIEKQNNLQKKNRRVLPIAWIARYNEKLKKPELFESPVLLDIYADNLSFQSYSKFSVDSHVVVWVVNNSNEIDEYLAKVEWSHTSRKENKKFESYDYGLKIDDNKFKKFVKENEIFFSQRYSF